MLMPDDILIDIGNPKRSLLACLPQGTAGKSG